MPWLFDPANSAAVGAYGLILGIIGLPLTLWGLYITFKQARLATTSADLAINAVKEFKARVSEQDTSRDISEALYALDITKRHIGNNAWRDALDSYEDARRAFIRINLANVPLANQSRIDLQKAINQMNAFCDKVEAALSGKSDYPETVKVSAIIRRNYELLLTVQNGLTEGPANG
ncbi:hypothetical protein HRV97_00515 [Sphingomonas sp. HHU CXW]|uniref:LemA family protein n=1 Tax=Sphingomonas hominis TaxID=2741495 RepID=A0ABX2JCQ8_9SPHN|nr:hypothetical protein [Sphingomonas hominis]NTS63638.1 hypothetical protein [Sphingomonas hominis]